MGRWIRRCKEKTKTHLDKILAIPNIVNQVENILWKHQGGHKPEFIEVKGELTFWIDSIDRRDMLKSILIEVIVSISRHHPTVLRFRHICGRIIFQTNLLTFDDCLHMESKEDLEEIKKLLRERIAKLTNIG